MIVGIGVDLVDIPRFERSIERTPRLLERLFAPRERALKPHSLAARYAATHRKAVTRLVLVSPPVYLTPAEIGTPLDRAAMRQRLPRDTNAPQRGKSFGCGATSRYARQRP